jgi:hypothetical protein
LWVEVEVGALDDSGGEGFGVSDVVEGELSVEHGVIVVGWADALMVWWCRG